MLSVSYVRDLLSAPKGTLTRIAYGYTFDRNTVYIYIDENDRLERVIEDHNGNEICVNSTDTFDDGYFREDIKRFYKDRTNSKLAELFETFGNPLSLV